MRISNKYHSDRYSALIDAGLQLRNSTLDDLIAHLTERCGSHSVEIGDGVELLSTGRVQVRSGVSPVCYTPSGLELSDGNTVGANAVVWCTDFGSMNIRRRIPDILGDGSDDIQI